jgi:hypothetical protein
VSSLCHVSAIQNGLNTGQGEVGRWLNLEVSTSAERSTEEREGGTEGEKQLNQAKILSVAAMSAVSCPRLETLASLCGSSCGDVGISIPDAATCAGSQQATCWRLWLGGDNGPVIGSGVVADVADEWRRAVSRMVPTETSSA